MRLVILEAKNIMGGAVGYGIACPFEKTGQVRMVFNFFHEQEKDMALSRFIQESSSLLVRIVVIRDRDRTSRSLITSYRK